MTSSKKIMLGLLLGIALGLFLGERVAPLKVVADGYVKLLQMTVLPYLTVSLLLSLGGLSLQEARRLGLKAGAVLLGLWAVALLYAFLIPLAFPMVQSGHFFSASLVEQRASMSFVDLYIPANPFHSLANNIVPAVVLFSVMTGIALIGVERKEAVLDLLRVSRIVLSRVTRFVTGLTPYGIFAVAANAAGTLSLRQLEHIQVYLLAYVAVSLLLCLWVLPGLVSALTPIPFGQVLGPVRDALITAFVVGDFFIVLPNLIEAGRDVLVRHGLSDQNAEGLTDVIVPASFNFPHTGKLLSLSFILFAGWFSDASISLAHYPRLALVGLMSFFGSFNAAIPFLLDTFRIPEDTFQLFLATSVINSRFGTLVAAVHTVAVGLLGSASLLGVVHFRPARLLRFGLITLLLTGGCLAGLHVTFSKVLKPEFKGREIIANMQPFFPRVDAKTYREAPPPAPAPDPALGVLEGIKARNTLRVGYVGNRVPYAFFNGRGELTGSDIEAAGRMARDLGVKLEFHPVNMESLSNSMNRGEVDILMSGIVVIPPRAASILFSEPYQEETLAFLVKDHLREKFLTWDQIRKQGPVKICCLNLPYFIDFLREQLPEAQLELIDPGHFESVGRPDATLLPAERGSIMTMLYPEYSVVVPEPGIFKVPLAYPLARHDKDWQAFVNTWIELSKRNGMLDKLYDHWVLGKNVEMFQPRWSVIRNLLHWVK